MAGSESGRCPGDKTLALVLRCRTLIRLWRKTVAGSWQVVMRCVASAMFLLAHGLLVLEHVAVGTALHGVAELFLAPWAVRHRAWDIIVIGVVFCVFDLWGTVRLTGAIS
jgi:hypothetical protein